MTIITKEIALEFYIEECYSCGVPFGISTSLRRKLLNVSQTFYCPNGHGQIYTESTEDKLKKAQQQLAREQKDRAWWQDEANRKASELKNTKNSLRATKAAHTRTKKRIANGVCPVCNRQFTQLQRHMETQHPDFGRHQAVNEIIKNAQEND